MALDHQKLDVYRHALALLKACDEIIKQLPKGRATLQEQLDSAASSVVANIAEGAGEFSGKEKARFYRIARRSAIEIAAWVEIIACRREAPMPLSNAPCKSCRSSCQCSSGSSNPASANPHSRAPSSCP